MKVFAHYFKSEDGNDYRWRTLLQFGSSWDVIGSVVMKNPGSATQLYTIKDEETLTHLRRFSSSYEWSAIKPDNTMLNIERLFGVYYHKKTGNATLNGIVQVFNLMNVRDPNLEMALVRNEQSTSPYSKTTEQDIQQLIAPVYLGWGDLGFSPTFKESAERIFHIVSQHKDGKYLQPIFEDNKFYHPQWLMMRGKNHPNSQYMLNSFCQNTINPIFEQIVVTHIAISKKKIFEDVVVNLRKDLTIIEDKPKVCRFQLSEELVLTVTYSGIGYIGIRHKDYTDYYEQKDYSNSMRYRSILNDLDYNTSMAVWLGEKDFKQYGDEDRIIIENILLEVKKFKSMINK